jgi:hypothetical protein
VKSHRNCSDLRASGFPPSPGLLTSLALSRAPGVRFLLQQGLVMEDFCRVARHKRMRRRLLVGVTVREHGRKMSVRRVIRRVISGHLVSIGYARSGCRSIGTQTWVNRDCGCRPSVRGGYVVGHNRRKTSSFELSVFLSKRVPPRGRYTSWSLVRLHCRKIRFGKTERGRRKVWPSYCKLSRHLFPLINSLK